MIPRLVTRSNFGTELDRVTVALTELTFRDGGFPAGAIIFLSGDEVRKCLALSVAEASALIFFIGDAFGETAGLFRAGDPLN